MEDENYEVIDMQSEDLSKFVNEIVDKRFVLFKTQLDLEMMPVRLAILAYETQITEMRTGQSEVLKSLGRIEGREEAWLKEFRHYHDTNNMKIDAFFTIFHEHIGQHTGKDKAKDDETEHSDRKHVRAQGWVRAGIGVVSAGGIWKVCREWWLKYHNHH